ncbi:MAG TPA: metallophosphoesterase [Gammaproteobacteria bacterium]|nr:metallophosphoesterase [Gammaproteobacteria bacterium]
MRLLFYTFVLGYAGMQLYGVAQAHTGLSLQWPVTSALVAWVALMTTMPFLVWRWEARGWHRPVIVGSWLGYTWMGLAFLFFWIALAHNIIGALLTQFDPLYITSPRNAFFQACGITALVALYGFVDARRLRVEKVTLTSPKLPAGGKTLRIALISDVHLGAIVHTRRLRSILAELRRIEPDVLISAGDLVDGQADRLSDLEAMLADFRPPLGKFAVTGNHEYFVGLDRALAFHERAGFAVLRGQAEPVGEALTVAGVDDPTGKRMGQPGHTNERAALESAPRGHFTLLIKHQPLVDETASADVDLQVSGHVHKGQIFPFGWLVRLRYPVDTGLSEKPGGGWLYVSRGTGTWGPPFRVGAAPEITVFEFTPTS